MRTVDDIRSEIGEARRAEKRTDNALKTMRSRHPGIEDSDPRWDVAIAAHRGACEARRVLERELRGTQVPPARKSGLCQRPGSDLPEVCQSVSRRIA